MSTTLSKQYAPVEVESRWNECWLARGFFHADESAASIPYAITLPPPNVTGSLHIGHALGSTMQDILVRWRRMQGYNAMWMPGTDHASIAVHHLLEKQLRARENVTRFDLGRDEFLRRAWAWREKSGGRIGEQERLMGFSLDWERERFTMDEASNKAVTHAFVRLFNEGLIYRANRMIHWDPVSSTVVSDLEVDHVDEAGSLWSIRYPLADGSGEIVVATTRPETMLGDTAVAVHPEDERYAGLIGKLVTLPLTDRTIPIVADAFVDKEFGTGAVKITPAHDENDYACSQRLGLPILQIIDKTGHVCAPAPARFVGLSVEVARAAVAAELEAQGFLVETKDHKVPRARSQRSGAVIEPMLMEQWFVKAEPLAKPAIDAVEQGKTKFVPASHVTTYMHWMKNIRDWCISRQLWWGHRIPAWYCPEGHITVSEQTSTACATCGAAVTQDEDILDTWFSSALWPFSTLGWPDKTRALQTFYPNAVLTTGPDIIFFWVARMMMMGLHFCGKVPFRTVYLTAIVTDENGKKMSKTTGNVIDPLDIVQGATLDALVARAESDNLPKAAIAAIRKNFKDGIPPMGVDALRFSLTALNTSGRYIRLSLERVEGYRNFINKLWNASRFVLMNMDGYEPEKHSANVEAERSSLDMVNRWILSRTQRVAAAVDAALEAFRFADAANALYQFVWYELCDWYIELAKSHLRVPEDTAQAAATAETRHATQAVLAYVLDVTLRLLHPIVPFVTEEIWAQLPKRAGAPESLMITLFPKEDTKLLDAVAETEMAELQDVVVGVRMLRATYNVSPAQRVAVIVRCADDVQRARLVGHAYVIERMAKVDLQIEAQGPSRRDAAKTVVGSSIEVLLPLAGLIDPAVEKVRISKEIGKTEKEIAGIVAKLGNSAFIERAPEDIVAEQRARLVDEQARRVRLSDALALLDSGVA